MHVIAWPFTAWLKLAANVTLYLLRNLFDSDKLAVNVTLSVWRIL